MQIPSIPLTRRNLHLGHLLQILLIIQTIPQHIPEIPQRPLQRISRSLLFRLLKCRRLALAVLNMPVPDVLVEGAVADGDAHDGAQAEGDLAIGGVLVDEIDLDVLDGGAPAVEAENFVGEVDDLFGGEVVDFAAAGARAGGDVFRAELAIEARLEGGDLAGGVGGRWGLRGEEGVCCGGGVAVLVTWSGAWMLAGKDCGGSSRSGGQHTEALSSIAIPRAMVPRRVGEVLWVACEVRWEVKRKLSSASDDATGSAADSPASSVSDACSRDAAPRTRLCQRLNR